MILPQLVKCFLATHPLHPQSATWNQLAQSLSLQWWHSPLDFILCAGQTAAGHEVDPGEFLFLVSGLWWLWVPAPERWWGDHRGGSEGWWHAQRACLRTEKAGLSCPGSPDEEESRVMKGSNTCGLSSPPNTALMWQSFLLTLSKQRTNSSYLQARWGRRWGRGVGTRSVWSLFWILFKNNPSQGWPSAITWTSKSNTCAH